MQEVDLQPETDKLFVTYSMWQPGPGSCLPERTVCAHCLWIACAPLLHYLCTACALFVHTAKQRSCCSRLTGSPIFTTVTGGGSLSTVIVLEDSVLLLISIKAENGFTLTMTHLPWLIGFKFSGTNCLQYFEELMSLNKVNIELIDCTNVIKNYPKLMAIERLEPMTKSIFLNKDNRYNIILII
jgi:hypothetical protein